MHRIILISFLFISLQSGAQTMAGSWYGKADVVLDGTFNNYLTELVIKQKGNKVEGIFGYYFRNGYQSFYVKGTYDPQTRQISIPDIPVVFYKANSIDGVTCNMSFEGTLHLALIPNTNIPVRNCVFYFHRIPWWKKIPSLIVVWLKSSGSLQLRMWLL